VAEHERVRCFRSRLNSPLRTILAAINAGGAHPDQHGASLLFRLLRAWLSQVIGIAGED
jgi:hypothetical protein